MYISIFALLSVVSWYGGGAIAASSMQYFTNATLPSKDLTLPCANALTSTLPCDPLVKRLLPGHYYDQNGLVRACTSGCDAALGSWQASVNSACAGQNYQDTNSTASPIAKVPDLMRYAYNLTCLQANGEFCNVLARNASMGMSQVGEAVSGMAAAATVLLIFF